LIYKKSHTIVLLIIFRAILSSAQINKIGGGIEFLSSGNGHGGFSVPYISIERRRNTLMSGLMIRGGRIRGGKITWLRNLSEEDVVLNDPLNGPDKFQLNFMSYLEYVCPMEISRKLASQEEMIWRGNGVDYNLVKISTIETGFGIEFRIGLDDWTTIRSFIGWGFYYHPQYVKMDHERSNITLQLGVAINFLIGKK
jgi:hypothetical protein